MKKVTFSLDHETVGKLNRLARPRAGNKSFVVREAIRLMWEADTLETQLAEVESDSAFRASMARALRQVRNGKVVAHSEVERRFRRKQKK